MKFGYDHAAELAKAIAKRLDIEYVSLFVSLAKRAQKQLSPNERKKQIKFRLKRGDFTHLKGKSAFIVDDIITSGSSMASASNLLKQLGVRNRMAACIGIAYKDIDEKRKFPSLL